MRMFRRRIEAETPELDAEGVRLRFIGRRSVAGASGADREDALGGVRHRAQRPDHAVRRVQLRWQGRDHRCRGDFTGGDEDEFRKHLYAPDMHDPDLIIRTSGEQRISNYLMWQSAYSEFVFREELWPDFSREVSSTA